MNAEQSRENENHDEVCVCNLFLFFFFHMIAYLKPDLDRFTYIFT